ncbi:MAG: M28 family peptidase [Cyanobacteria bacterium J069]
MKRSWVSWLLGVLVVLAIAAWRSHSGLQPSAARLTLAVSPSTPALNAERLLADVAALSFGRYDAGDRQRAADYIERSLEAAGWQVERAQFATTEHLGENLIATRPSPVPIRPKLLLAAHYDTVDGSPGADDNATAIATILEAARLLGQDDAPYELELALFDLEEIGLEGSKAFVEDALRLQDLRGVVVMDMIGYGCEVAGCQSYPSMLPIEPPSDRGSFLAVIGDRSHPALIQAFHQIADAAPPFTVTPVFSLAVPLLGDLTPDLLRSDHTSFWKKGIGAVLLTDTANFRNPHYHQPSDTPDTLNPEFFLGSARLVIQGVDLLLHSGE